MPLTCSQFTDIEKRFAHLLQPIRDLTKNWDIDLASDLEQYLEEIENIVISFDNGQTVMNFAEAAMVIQGSTSVYSKKVEFLYSLTCQILGVVSNKKKLKNAQVDENGNTSEAAETAEEQFLSLDDNKEHININLRDNQEEKNVSPLPVTPMILLKKNDNEQKGDNPLLSKKGDLIGSRGDFHVNISLCHNTGTILLDATEMNSVRCSFGTAVTSTPFLPQQHAPMDVTNNSAGELARNDLHSDFNTEPICPPVFEECPRGDDYMECSDAEPNVQPNDMVAEGARRSEREHRPVESIETCKTKPVIDLLQLLDPHTEESALSKPSNRGVPVRIPEHLRKPRKRKKTPVAETVIPISKAICDFFDKKTHNLPKSDWLLPSYQGFESLYHEEYQRRQTLYKNLHRLQFQNQQDVQAVQFIQEESPGDDLVFANPDENNDDFEEDGANDHFSLDIQLDDIHPASIHAPHPYADLLATTTLGDQGTAFEDLVRKHIEGFLAEAQRSSHKSELEKRVSRWEDKIIPILEEEAMHATFDIHKYGAHLIKNMKLGEVVDFREIVGHKRPFEISRYFLSKLQLANNYNIEVIDQGDVLSRKMDSLHIKLIDSQQKFANLAEL